MSLRLNLSWLVFGDFNEIISNSEEVGGARRYLGQMNSFIEALTDCNLLELPFTGGIFTWSHGSGSDLILERFDRMVATPSWYSIFLHAFATSTFGLLHFVPNHGFY